MTETMDGEERANFHQRVAELERLNAAMTLTRSEDGLNSASLDAAHKIEDLFVAGHIGGRSQRLAKVQIVVREAMREMLVGEEHWQASTDLQNATTPLTRKQELGR